MFPLKETYAMMARHCAIPQNTIGRYSNGTTTGVILPMTVVLITQHYLKLDPTLRNRFLK